MLLENISTLNVFLVRTAGGSLETINSSSKMDYRIVKMVSHSSLITTKQIDDSIIHSDWNELFTTKCFACGFPVEAGDRWVEALNNNYHSQCFNCSVSNQMANPIDKFGHIQFVSDVQKESRGSKLLRERWSSVL